MQDKLAIIIPTYNERENVRRLILSLLSIYPQARLFIVDDNSPDGTAQVVAELAKQYGNVRLLWREEKQGLASAYLDAFARILPDDTIHYIVTMDADFSHNPAELPHLLEHIFEHDLVVGSRYLPNSAVRNWGVMRRLISRYANLYARFITGVPIRDLTTGFVVYHRNLLGQILQHSIKIDAYGYQIEMKYLAHRLGSKMKEVPITFRERDSGKSKFGWSSIWEGVIVPWYLRLFKKHKVKI